MSAMPAFVFNCHRCGHCRSVGHGRVWIEAEEIDSLAAACGSEPASFLARQVVQVGDRLSWREKSNGSCALLEEGNRCTVYEARQAQWRTFPFWPEILADESALERASGYCPVIQRIPAPALAAAILPRARTVLRRFAAIPRLNLEAAGARCDLESFAAETGYPWSVGPWERLLAEQAQGWDYLHGGPPRLASVS